MLTAAAITLALPRRCAGNRSISVAVAVPVNTPADRPDSTRPASSIATLPANTNTAELAADSASPNNRTGRRPSWSDSPPKSNKPAITPTAYVAKMTVTISPPKPYLAS